MNQVGSRVGIASPFFFFFLRQHKIDSDEDLLGQRLLRS